MTRSRSRKLGFPNVFFKFCLLVIFLTGCKDKSDFKTIQSEPGIVGVGIPTEVMVVHSTEQQSQNWCWAASAQMALSTQGFKLSQKEIVRTLFGRLVDAPGGVPQFVELCGNHQSAEGSVHVSCEFGGGSPPINFLIQSLREKRPVILGCDNPGSNIGHAVVATAVIYQESSLGPKLVRVMVRDPWPGEGKRILLPEEYRNISFHASYRVMPSGN